MGSISNNLAKSMDSNAVFLNMMMLEDIAEDVVTGKRKNVVVSGPPGVGKNYVFEGAFARHSIPWQPERPGTEQALIEHIYQTNGPNQINVFDECDHFYRSLRTINVLKILTDPKASTRILSLKTRNPDTTIPPFEVYSRNLFLMNTNSYDPRMVNNKTYGCHIEAFNSRCLPIALSFDHRAIYEYTLYLVVCKKMLKLEGFSREVSELALDYFCSNMNRMREVSPRRIRLIALEIQRNPAKWRLVLESMLVKPFCALPTWRPRLEPRSTRRPTASRNRAGTTSPSPPGVAIGVDTAA